METFDLVVGGDPKSLSNGGGYSGFLNTVLALAFVEYLEESGAYSPGLFVVDSSVTMLSESEYKATQNTMKTGFLRYLRAIYERDSERSQYDKSSFGITEAPQIIIVEQKDKLPMLEEILSDAPHTKIIEFTQDKEHGRYGFLNNV